MSRVVKDCDCGFPHINEKEWMAAGKQVVMPEEPGWTSLVKMQEAYDQQYSGSMMRIYAMQAAYRALREALAKEQAK
jgi:hypothetical protein